MSIERQRDNMQPQAKEEWERILDEALRDADLGAIPSRKKEEDPVLWELDELLGEIGAEEAPPAEDPLAALWEETAETEQLLAEADFDRRDARYRAREEAPKEAAAPVRRRTQKEPDRRAEPRRERPDRAPAPRDDARRRRPAPGSKDKRESTGNPKLQKFRKNRFWLLGFLWLSIVFTEFVIRIATIRESFWEPGLLFTMLFAIGPAILFFVGLTLCKNPKVNRVIAISLMAVMFLLYASQLIYYKVFGQFYTFMSMTNADQGFGFMSTIISTIFSNLHTLIILVLPLIFIIALGKKFFSFKGGAKLVSSAVFVGLAVVIHFFLVLILPIWGKDAYTPYDVYHYTYEVKDSAAQLGLGTAFRLDTKWFIFKTGKSHDLDLTVPEFNDGEDDPKKDPTSTGENDPTNDPADTQPTEEGETLPPATAPIEYGYNVLDLDFEALAAAEGDKDIRDMHLYFSNIEPTKQNPQTGLFKGCNLILITAEAMSHLAIDPELTPTLYKMQTEGIHFTNFYTSSWGGSTTDGEYAAVTGTIPKSGVWSFKQTGLNKNYMPLTMCAHLKNLGYSAYAYHNHTHTYYSRDKSHPNLGYIYKGMGNGLEEGVKKQWPESDVEMIDFTVSDYIGQEPFHAYYMTVSGHLQYNFLGGNRMSSKHKDAVAHLSYSDTVKAYLATQIELDKAMELLLQKLEEAGVAENTVIAMSADHYPYGLTAEEISELQGHELETNFEMYRNACIIYKKGMTPIVVDEACSSLDFLPTLCNLFGVEFDSRLYIGRDVFSDADPLVIFLNRSWITDKASYNSNTKEVISLTGEEVSEEYVDYIKAVVKNKFSISTRILEEDYWRALFKPE